MKLMAVTLSLWAGMAGAAGTDAAPAPNRDISLSEFVAAGCAKDVDTYCKSVTAGEGRVLACLVAHEDKLSSRCIYVLNESASALNQLVSALDYVTGACKADIKALCGEVKPGGGRIAACMKQNEAKVSEGCKQAIADTGITVTTK